MTICNHEWEILEDNELSSSCIFYCSKCHIEESSYNIAIFTIDELKEIYKLLEYQYIPYENEKGHAVINKIAKIIKENE